MMCRGLIIVAKIGNIAHNSNTAMFWLGEIFVETYDF